MSSPSWRQFAAIPNVMHYDHITISTSPERFRCAACGAEEPVITPVPLVSLDAQAAAFIAAHRNCPIRRTSHD